MRSSGLIELEAVLAVARHRRLPRGCDRPRHVALGAEPRDRGAGGETGRAPVQPNDPQRLADRGGRAVRCRRRSGAGRDQRSDGAGGSHRATPAGTLRINTSAGAARQIEPLVFEYLRRYPDMKVDIVTEGRLVDIVADGFDAGVRLAELVPQDMIAVPLGPDQRFAVVGSPAYFKQHPKPRTPADLSRHRCIRSRLPSGGSIVGSSSATAKRWRSTAKGR